ncbi:hypothetical protein RFI_08991 [Reticulomyxa filosa]|uniref:Uncharacterized protein n=1 Tax=Reticulomyxa filosa TaxID=46433 RepID=X6NQ38_RETFI|nr:hypothetical protein RFI_08991 [Reticulomyxa filosa]|eukprot:ETO28141.1 hypothetical protein RFI_08991 [Reticulomyxa filosa]
MLFVALKQLPTSSREPCTNFLRKGLQVELRKHFFSFDEIYEKCLFLNKFYDKVANITEEKYVQEPIKRQDADTVQGRCTWGPRKDNSFDRNAFDLVCKHRSIKPLTEASAALLANDFDSVYLMFCQALADKLREPLVNQLLKMLDEHKPLVQAVPAKNFEKFSKRIKSELAQYASPKAARILDYLSVEVAFENVKDLIVGFVKIGKNFKICRIANQLSDKVFVKNNVRYVYVYVIAEHPDNNFIKLVCELRITLKAVFQLNNEQRLLIQHFESFLGTKEATEIQKEVLKKLGETKKEHVRQKSSQQQVEMHGPSSEND